MPTGPSVAALMVSHSNPLSVDWAHTILHQWAVAAGQAQLLWQNCQLCYEQGKECSHHWAGVCRLSHESGLPPERLWGASQIQMASECHLPMSFVYFCWLRDSPSNFDILLVILVLLAFFFFFKFSVAMGSRDEYAQCMYNWGSISQYRVGNM